MISIIICTYNREKYIGQTLERLAANVFDGEWEIILVDNNCTDSTPSICADFASRYPMLPFRYFLEKKQGLSNARNRGMVEAGSQNGRTPQPDDMLVFLDDDAFVGPDYLNRLSQYRSELPEMQAFGGKIMPFFEAGNPPQWLCRWNRSWLSAIDKGNAVCRFEGAEYPIGANMGITRAVADSCGFFDANLGRSGKNLIGGEEKDYFNRIKAAEAVICYLPEIAVEHCIPPSRTTDAYIRRLGQGVGMSERARTKATGAYAKRVFMELIKWGATFVLWLLYLVSFRPACGNSLILFRRNVTAGLLGLVREA